MFHGLSLGSKTHACGDSGSLYLLSGGDLLFVFMLLIETIGTVSLSSQFYYKIDNSDTLDGN